MIANDGTIQILEYQRLYIDDENITQEVFNDLENFILESDVPFLILKSDRGKKYIQAQCYAGVIKLKNGFTIEILPKIIGLENNIEKSKEILIKMINSLQNAKLSLNFWKEIYSLNKKFSVYKNKNIDFVILFDMNILFKNYMGQFFKKNCKVYREYSIKLQNSNHYLAYNNNNKYFKLEPDVTIEITNSNNEIIENVIFDTKWQQLSKNDKICQSDIYKMFSYGIKYENCKKLYLVYPFTNKQLEQMEYKFNKNITLKILFFDLKIDEFK